MSLSPKYPALHQIEAIYRHREGQLARLATYTKITVADISTLDRLGRCDVANRFWLRCESACRDALLNDPHHFVRSCAQIAAAKEDHLTGKEVEGLMRKYKITIRDLAKRMRITMKRVREVRSKGITGNCMCMDWREAITGTGFFSPHHQ